MTKQLSQAVATLPLPHSTPSRQAPPPGNAQAAADLLKRFIAWWPKADPGPEWVAEAGRLLARYDDQIHAGIADRVQAEMRTFPSVPMLRQIADRLTAERDERLKRPANTLPSAQELTSERNRLAISWLNHNHDVVAECWERGHLGRLIDWLQNAAWYGAQASHVGRPVPDFGVDRDGSIALPAELYDRLRTDPPRAPGMVRCDFAFRLAILHLLPEGA